MPRDKTQTHEKIVQEAEKEFLELGYAQASLKNIADRVGITSAALYRHYANKQDLYASFVMPAVRALHRTAEPIVLASDEEVRADSRDLNVKFDTTRADADYVLNTLYKCPEAFYLLFFCSKGTVYSVYLEDLISRTVMQMKQFLESCEKRGIRVRPVSESELHMLICGYVSALLQPIEKRIVREDAEQYLKTVMDFYTPGWRLITGL